MTELSDRIANTLIQAGEQFWQRGKLDQAKYSYLQALQLNTQASQTAEIKRKLGDIFFQLKQLDEAEIYYQQVIELAPNIWEVYYGLGNVRRQTKQWQTAIIAYRQSLEINPNFFWSYYYLGEVFAELQQWHEALNCYEQVTHLQPDFWEAYHSQGNIFLQMKQWQSATIAYRQALKIHQGFFWTHYNLGIVLAEQHQWQAAISEFQKAVKIKPDFPPLSAHFARALKQQGKFNLQQALTYYQQAIIQEPHQIDYYLQALAIEPNNAQIYLNLGKILVQQNQIEIATKYYQQALQYQSENVDYSIYAELQFNLANLWLIQGKIESAISGYKITLQLNPQHLAAHLELASLKLQQGQLKTAFHLYQQALELDSQQVNFCHYLLQKIQAKIESKNIKPNKIELNHRLKHIAIYTDCCRIYGAEQLTHLLVCGLVQAGYQVTCLQTEADNYLIRDREKLGIQHLWVQADNAECLNDFLPRLPSTLVNASEPAQIFAQIQPDLIIFIDASIMSSLMPKQIAKQLGIPYIISAARIHLDALEQFADYLHYLPEIYQQAWEVLTVSQDNLDLLHQHFGLTTTKGQVIYPGRPEIFFQPNNSQVLKRIRHQLDLPVDAIVLCTIARIDLEKGYQYQLKAIEQLQQTKIWSRLYFVWVGLGGQIKQLQNQVANWGIERQVKFLGEREDIADILDAADIFVLPSLYEGMPLAVMEAMAKGLPIIATNVSGIAEELGNTGKLLPDPKVDAQATVKELVETIKIWVNNPELRHSLGQAGQKRAREMFREQNTIDRYLNLIQDIL